MKKETKVINGVSVDFVHPDLPSTKPPILFVHGGCHGSWCWDNYQTYFASLGYETVALNWFNHPGSKKLPEREFAKRSILDVATEIDFVAKSLDQTPILFGHSMGGLASLHYSTIQNVVALVLLAPVIPSVIGAPQIPIPIDQEKIFPVPPFEQAYPMFFMGSSQEDAHKYHGLLCPESAQTVFEASNSSAEVDLAKVTVPSLLFGAGQDMLVPHDRVEKLAKAIDGTYIYLADRSHNLLLEPRWGETTTKINNWLQTVI